LLDNLFKSFCDLSVTGTCFSNNEIEEDNTCHTNSQAPKQPEEDIFSLCKRFRISDGREVTHAHSEGPEELTCVKTNGFVISCQWLLKFELFIWCQIGSQGCITESKNCKELGEEQNQDEVEEQEDSQIENDIC